jgi:hypothetical protein
MAIPPTAAKFARVLDPHEELDWMAPCSPLLELGEQIDSFEVVVLPEAAALGLTIMSGSGRDIALAENDTGIVMWLTIDDAFVGDAAFEGAGTALGMEVTIVTNSTPPRTRNRTFVVQVAQL